MRKKDFYYNSQSQNCKGCFTIIILVIFCFTVTTFSLVEISNFYADKNAVRDILIDDIKSFEAAQTSKDFNNKYEESVNPLNAERQARAAGENNTISLPQNSNSYYEEQRPVIVYSKTDIDSPIVRQQISDIPPKQDTEDDDPYGKAAYDGIYEDSDNDDDDYFGQSEPKQSESSPSYYSQQQDQQQQSAEPYYRQPAGYYSQPQSYYDDARERQYFPASEPDQSDSQEARAAKYRERNTYYRPYPYAATPSSIPLAGIENSKRLVAGNNAELRNMQMPTRNQAPQQHYRDPYYEYLPPNSQSTADIQPPHINHNYPPQRPQYRTPSTTPPAPRAEDKSDAGQQMDFLTMFRSIKTMWDLYQSFTNSWNTIAERRNREQELAQQKYKQQQQQQMRINSRKPPKFNSRKNNTMTMKSPKKQVITNATATTITPTAPEVNEPTEDQIEHASNNKQPVAKVEPRKGFKLKAKPEEAIRDKRQTAADAAKGTNSVGEGRYIKGDPLKGYYDFVITEGSYKFWAAFQVGTAILIIYSTFAAIYYSKVNPLVSDYDYTDYLGGARSLSGGDLDFVDDGDEEAIAKKTKSTSWLEWMPRTGHSLKFILEAIDKLPADHVADHREEQTYSQTMEEEVKDDATAELADDEAELEAHETDSTETEQLNETPEFLENKDVFETMKHDQQAM